MSFADKIEDLAAKATKGPWQVRCRLVKGVTHFAVLEHTHASVVYDVEYWGGRRVPTMDHDGYLVRNADCDIGDTKAAAADYIALMNPARGLAIARALRAAANVGPVLYAYLHEQDTNDHNLRALKEEVESALAALEATEGA